MARTVRNFVNYAAGFLFFSVALPLLAEGGKFLSSRDREFQQYLIQEEDINRKLGTLVTFVVNEKKFPVDKGIVGKASKVFFALLTNGMKESANNGEILLSDDSDIFLKTLRLIYHKKYDHDSENKNVLFLTLEMLDYYELERLKIEVIRNTPSDDETLAREALSYAEQLENGAKLKSLLFHYCKSYVFGYYGHVSLESLFDFLDDRYFEERVPGFYELAKKNGQFEKDDLESVLAALKQDDGERLKELISIKDIDVNFFLLSINNGWKRSKIELGHISGPHLYGKSGHSLLVIAMHTGAKNCVNTLIEL